MAAPKGRKPTFKWTDHQRALAVAEWLGGSALAQIGEKRGYAPGSTGAGPEIMKFCVTYSGLTRRAIQETQANKRRACRLALDAFMKGQRK